MVDYSVYLLYRAGIWLLTLLPLPVLFAVGQLAGTVVWLISRKYRTLALRNIRIAFGDDLATKEARRLVRRHFQRLGANLLCSVKITHMPIEKILEGITPPDDDRPGRLKKLIDRRDDQEANRPVFDGRPGP